MHSADEESYKRLEREHSELKQKHSELKHNFNSLLRDFGWVLQTIHSAYHEEGTWRQCKKGVCGSMPHILSMAGVDVAKELDIRKEGKD